MHDALTQKKEVRVVGTGNIAVISGLKHTITGDTLVETEKIAKEASLAYREKFSDNISESQKKIRERRIQEGKSGVISEVLDEEKTGLDRLILAGIDPPEPVYFCSIEAPSVGAEKKLEEALKQLTREDPSVRVYFDEQSLQTILEGQGELHIEIIKDRLLREWKLDVFLGPLEINYRECVKGYGEYFTSMEETLNERKQHVGLKLSVSASQGAGKLRNIEFWHEQGATSLANLRKDWLGAIIEGCKNACGHGPLLGYPVEDIAVTLHGVEATKRVSLPLITACANNCLMEAMKGRTQIIIVPDYI